MTYLELVNATLRRLRRQEVTSVAASSYAKLVGDFVNLAKREVEDAWDWLPLMTELNLTTAADTNTYTLTGFGDRYWIKQINDTTNKGTVYPIGQARANYYTDFSDQTSSTPSYWRINGGNNDDPFIEFWPTPSGAVNLTVYAKVAQVDLSDSADILSIPSSPVLAGAYLRALDERGEDGGTNSQVAGRDYRMALSDAIAQDNANRGGGMASDWCVA